MRPCPVCGGAARRLLARWGYKEITVTFLEDFQEYKCLRMEGVWRP